MADDWSAFPDAEPDDPWAAFPDADAPRKPLKPDGKIADPGAPKLSSPDYPKARGFPQNVRMDLPSLDGAAAVDGDTLKAPDARVRVWGADAPELTQQGWDRQGNPVPIGRQSRDWLQGEIANAGNVQMGDVKSTSYGRLVGPVALDGNDVALGSVRSGNALAAPSFVRNDPDYRFKLMEAERLARLNGLGPMNDTLAQDPDEQRRDPDWQPSTETIAQFWDTPTPFAGMRPDAEKHYLALQASGTPEQIVSFAKAQGIDMNPAEVGKWTAWRDEQKAAGKPFENYANYQRGPEVIQQQGDGTFNSGARGFSEGFLAGGLGEAGAIADTLGGTPGRENVWNSDRRLADIWANNEWQNEAILRGDEYAHPTATTIGNIGGALTSGFVIPYGAGARTIPALAKVGGVYGGVEGFLGTDGTLPERLKGAVIGAPVGAAVNAVGGKALEVLTPGVARAVQALRRARGAGNDSGAQVAPDAAVLVGERQAAWPDVVQRLQSGEAEVEAGAIYHPELGEIDMRWGRPGDPANNYSGGFGLSHIQAKHGHEGIVLDLPERIAGMKVTNLDPQQERIQLEGPGGKAALATTWHGDEQRWVVTAFDPNWRPPPGETPMPSPIGAGPDSGLRGGADNISDLPPIGNAEDEWQDFPDAPDAERRIGMEAETAPSVSSDPLDDPQIASLINAGAGDATIMAVAKQRGLEPISLVNLKARRLLDPATASQRAAAAERIQPRDVLPIASNELDGPEEAAAVAAGRFAEAKVPDERQALSRGTVRGWNGSEVPKIGPTDMVGWLRLRGGLQDQGGELSHMGLTNAARRGLEHVGQEARFGPLVNAEGDTLDDAALAAWEAGFFPELTERPSVNEFLDALRDTYNGGSGRRFHPDDWEELERFEAMRGERYDLEQQQNEAGTIWQDRSVPGDDAAPFPPPEAFEDWGSKAPDFAGNIRLDKLESPQDIARALVQTERQVGFDAATRGRITHAETGRLAADLGMTADALLARRRGQALNAEEALAARQILAKSGNELVNAAKRLRSQGDHPGADDMADFRQKWIRHAAIQEQVSGMTAEAGRALQQFRQLASSQEVRSDVLASVITGAGGPKRLQEAADTLLEAVEAGPGVFNTVVEKAAQPKWRDKIAEWYVNALLGWPQTHVVNVTSNTLTAIAQIPEYATGALVGGVRQAFSREAVDRVTATEVGARAFGLLQGAKEGARLFAQALRTGEGSDFGSKVEAQAFKAIGGKVGEVVRLPTRFLTAEDELFKGVARRMELNAQAVRIARKEGLKGDEASRRIAELVADPTDDMFQRALDYGRYLTFQQKLGPFAQKVSAMASENLPLKFLLPFVRTPTNLMKFATERSPAAPLLSEWRADFRAGGERRDMAVAKMMVGTGFGLAMYEAAAAGTITGSAPSDPKKARLLYADGWKPYSIKIDGTYYSYKRLDPFSTTIGVAADLATLPEGMTEKQREDKGTLLVASIMGNLASKTWLSGASSFIEAISEPERYAGDFKNRLIASFLLPNFVGGTARALDPVARSVDSLGEEMQSRIPGYRDDLLPKRDVWGRPIKSEGGLGPDAFSPIWVSKELADPVNHELMQIDYAPGVPRKEVGGRTLTPEEYDRYQELAGKGSHDSLAELVGSAAWRAMNDTAKVKAAKKVVAAARSDARAKLFGGGKSEDDLEAVDDDAPASGRGPWSAFPDAKRSKSAGSEWDAFPDAPSRDVTGDLQRAIPGIRFTSGLRTPEYNAQLAARGYHPAKNSEHLDGSALDMLPPPGKSLEWLKRQVRRYDPKARLLVHDGHLHAGFNGYYKAPKLGGMARR